MMWMLAVKAANLTVKVLPQIGAVAAGGILAQRVVHSVEEPRFYVPQGTHVERDNRRPFAWLAGGMLGAMGVAGALSLSGGGAIAKYGAGILGSAGIGALLGTALATGVLDNIIGSATKQAGSAAGAAAKHVLPTGATDAVDGAAAATRAVSGVVGSAASKVGDAASAVNGGKETSRSKVDLTGVKVRRGHVEEDLTKAIQAQTDRTIKGERTSGTLKLTQVK